MITKDSENIYVRGKIGTWHVIDELKDNRGSFFLLEHDRYGDEAACIIINDKGFLCLDDVYNGFSDLNDLENDEITWNWVSDYLKSMYEKGYLFTRNIGTKSVSLPIEVHNMLSKAEVAIAEAFCLNEKRLPKHEFELLSIADAVDAVLLELDAYGYGDGFDDPDVFNDQEKRVGYMKDFLSDPEGMKSILSRLSGEIQEHEDDAKMQGRLGRLVDRLEDQWTRMEDAMLWPQQNNEEDRER